MINTTLKNIELTELEAKIIEILQNGKANATRLDNLVKRLSTNERKIRQAIESLRREGYAILITARGGYFFAENKAELDEYVAYMKSRLLNEYRTYKIVSRATKNKIGQVVQLKLV